MADQVSHPLVLRKGPPFGAVFLAKNEGEKKIPVP